MPTVTTFEAPGGTVHIEVSDEEGPSGARDLVEAGRAVAAIVSALGAELNNLDEANAPGEIVVSFGVVAMARGAWAVSLNEENANLRVRFKWTGAGPEDLG